MEENNQEKMKQYDQDNPIVQGSLHSTETTINQKILYNYIGYFLKIGKQLSLTKATLKIPKPNGHIAFVSEKDAIEKDKGRKLTKEELDILADQTIFDVLKSKELGNGQSIVNHLLGEIFVGDRYRKLLDECKKEAFEIASKITHQDIKAIPKSDLDLT